MTRNSIIAAIATVVTLSVSLIAFNDTEAQATPAPSNISLLAQAWEQAMIDTPGEVNVAVFDMQTGQTAEWHTPESGTFDTASTVKYAILVKNLLDHQASGTSMSQYDMSQAALMIEQSNNAAASYLWRKAGGQAGMQEFFDSLGMTNTHASSSWGLTQTTALDQLQVLKVVSLPGGPLTDESKNIMNGFLSNVVDYQHWGVSGGVPADVPVLLKNGWLNDSSTNDKYSDTSSWTVNSIGTVGDHYLMAVYSHGNPVGSNRAEQNGVNRIEVLSKITWDIMNQG